MNTTLVSIGQRIKELVDNKGISQNDLAKQIGTSSSQITNIIKGRAYGLEYLLNIISIYPEINMNWLMRGEGEMLLQEENQHQNINKNDTPKSNHTQKKYEVNGQQNLVGENIAAYGRESELLKEIEHVNEKNTLLEEQVQHLKNQIEFLQSVITKLQK